MNYKVGDTVVCIDAAPLVNNKLGTELQAGKKYRVLGFEESPCCGALLVKVKENKKAALLLCPCGKTHALSDYNFAWRFIKLDGLKQDQTTEKEVSA
jgi:hypothetical protein